MHPAEAPGRDIDCVSTGLWFDIAVEGNMHVDAAPLVHRGASLCALSLLIAHQTTLD